MNLKRLLAFSLFLPAVLLAAIDESSLASLRKADSYADFYNWSDARPLFAAADRALPRGSSEQLHAHLGYLRSTMETRSLPELSNYLAGLLHSPVLVSNLRLRLWCLGIKGDVDGEMDSASARADWEEAYKVAGQLRDKRWKYRSRAEAGFSAYLLGDIATGRRDVAAALLVAHQTGDIGAEIRYLSAIGTGIEWNGNYKEALGYFQKAFTLAEQHPECGFPFLTVAGEIETFVKERDYEAAAGLLKQASAAAVRTDKLIKLTQLMLFDADVAIGQQHPDKAVEILRRTISLAQRNQTRMLSDAQMKLAAIYRRQHRLALAEHYAVAAFTHTGLTKVVFTAPARLEFTAQLQWDLGRRTEARRSIMRALQISEGLLAQTSSGAVREGLLTEMSSAYETAFRFAAQSDDPAGAFAIIERVRGRITAETLVQPAHVPDDQINIELEDRIRNLKIRLIKGSSEGERNQIIEALFYAQQQRYVQDRPSPVYASKIEAVPLKRITTSLDPSQALLEYVVPQDGPAYCLLLSQQGANIVQLRSAKGVTALAKAFLEDLKDDKPWKENSRNLYDAILAPIPNIDHFHHLTIVADGDLHLIPFDALLTPSGILLGQTTITAYAPSAVSQFLLKTRTGPVMAQKFLGVGGAIYSRAGSKPFVIAKRSTRGAYLGVDPTTLPNLPGSQEEVQSAAEILRATTQNAILQTGSGATEFAFTHAPLSNFQIIHLAIHAVADRDDPSRAALVFPPDPQHEEDGLLESSDIANLRLGAEVVVLSACETAVGPLQGQVGVANLARAFLQAGADSVVSTLWPVNDLQSAYLMKGFYRHLANGKPAADALAMAKRDMLHDAGAEISPRSWAGFVLVGNGDAGLQSSRRATTIHLRAASSSVSE